MGVLKTKMMASEGTVQPSILGTGKDLLKNQGIAGFYRGIDSNIARAMVLNGTKMACYDQMKGYTVELTGLPKSHLLVQFLSAVSAGFFMTCTVSPFDMVRTRLMNQPADEDLRKRSRLLYTDCEERRSSNTMARFYANLVAI